MLLIRYVKKEHANLARCKTLGTCCLAVCFSLMPEPSFSFGNLLCFLSTCYFSYCHLTLFYNGWIFLSTFALEKLTHVLYPFLISLLISFGSWVVGILYIFWTLLPYHACGLKMSVFFHCTDGFSILLTVFLFGFKNLLVCCKPIVLFVILLPMVLLEAP